MPRIKDILDKSQDTTAGQRKALEELEELGRTKAALIEKELKESLLYSCKDCTQVKVPISSISGCTCEIRAFSNPETGKIWTAVNDSLAKFLSGNKKDNMEGIGNFLADKLSAFFNGYEAIKEENGMYMVGTDGHVPVRIDVRPWCSTVTSEAIREKMGHIAVVVAVKSVVDIRYINLATFLYFYQKQFKPLELAVNEKRRLINDAAEIFEEFERSESEKH
jgi:hypothetical protein